MSIQGIGSLQKNYSDTPIGRLPEDVLTLIFRLVLAGSKKDIDECRLVCHKWKKSIDWMVLNDYLNVAKIKWVDKSLFKIKSRSNGISSQLSTPLAIVLGNKPEAFQLLRGALSFTDKMFSHMEKPQEFDWDLFTGYLKVIRAYARIGKLDEISTFMKGSNQALRISMNHYEIYDSAIFTKIAQVFVSSGSIEQVLDLVRSNHSYGVDKLLLVRAIKTYKNNEKTHELFLKELDFQAKPIFEQFEKASDKNGRRDRSIVKFSSEFGKSLELAKGYCYLGRMDKALELIKVAETGGNKCHLNEEWESRAYTVIARAYAARKQIEKTKEYSDKITKPYCFVNGYQKEVLVARAYAANEEWDNAFKFLQSAEKEAKKMGHMEGSRAFLKIAKGYFRINSLFQARSALKEAETRAAEVKDYEPHYQTKTYTRIARTMQYFMLSMVSKEKFV